MVYTCDSCGRQEALEAQSKFAIPQGWGCVAFNLTSPDPAWDQPAWERHQLCPTCVKFFKPTLPNLDAIMNPPVPVPVDEVPPPPYDR